MPTYLPNAKSSDVIGQLLLGVDQAFERSDTGVYYAWSFYRLGSGLVITLGFDEEGEDALFHQAIALNVRDLEGAIGNRVESAWELPDDFDFSPYTLRMDNGLYIVEILHAIEGTGSPGVCVLPQAEITWELKRVW